MTFERRDCKHCNATGAAFDITNADKVYVRPGSDTCSTCRGRGFTEHLSRVKDSFVKPPAGPIGDIPDWMC